MRLRALVERLDGNGGRRYLGHVFRQFELWPVG
jgi:hypothetical protein